MAYVRLQLDLFPPPLVCVSTFLAGPPLLCSELLFFMDDPTSKLMKFRNEFENLVAFLENIL